MQLPLFRSLLARFASVSPPERRASAAEPRRDSACRLATASPAKARGSFATATPAKARGSFATATPAGARGFPERRASAAEPRCDSACSLATESPAGARGFPERRALAAESRRDYTCRFGTASPAKARGSLATASPAEARGFPERRASAAETRRDCAHCLATATPAEARGSPARASFLALALCLFAAPLGAQQPTVSNVSAQQLAGTKEVAISYNLAISGGGTATVTVKASRDNGATYEDVPVASLSGAFGAGQSAGSNKTIVWDAGAIGWEAALYPQARVRVTATSADMVLVQGGTLAMSMGTRTVETFWIGIYEMTWGEWKAVRAEAAARGYDIGSVGAGCAADHPVHTVAWFDVLKWCNAKSQKEGLEPVYTVSGAVYKTGEPTHTSITQNLSANGYRLPLEAEWEFAARGGNQTNGYTYSGSNDLNAVGWYWDNSGGAACTLWSGRGTWPVGQKAANELGLYDMSGNVWEWCWDRWSDTSSARVSRGGSWSYNAANCTVSIRFSSYPSFRLSYLGFRLARSAG